MYLELGNYGVVGCKILTVEFATGNQFDMLQECKNLRVDTVHGLMTIQSVFMQQKGM